MSHPVCGILLQQPKLYSVSKGAKSNGRPVAFAKSWREQVGQELGGRCSAEPPQGGELALICEHVEAPRVLTRAFEL